MSPNDSSSTTPHSAAQRGLMRDWRLLLYNAAIVVFGPYFLARKIHRSLTKKTGYEFLRQRWTIPVEGGQNDDPQALHVVFVSTGFGEKHTTEQLTAALKAVRPQVRTTWATKADVTVEVMQREHPEQAATYMPFDFWPSVAHWLDRLKPDVVVSVEKLWVPNIAWGARAWGAPVLVVCGRRGRYRDKSGKRALWQAINAWTLRAYQIICLQSEVERERLAPVLPPGGDVRVTGAIKISQSNQARPTTEVLTRWIEAANAARLPILAAGSTADREEEAFVLDAFQKARAAGPCVLLIAPRRLHRVQETLDLLDQRGLSWTRRTDFQEGMHTPAGCDVLVLDSMGELSSAYKFCEAAFVGGTLAGGGHNVIEPLEWGAPVFFGAGAKDNPPAAQSLVLETGAGFRVETPAELGDGWARVLTEPARREELRARCETVIAEQKQALEENLRAIIEVVDQVAGQRSTPKT